MKFLSVFSGIDAASVAWEPLGMKAVGFSEIEKFPSAVLAHHWPDVPNLGDITKHADWQNLHEVDILVGGSPCQAFSVAGLRNSLADSRGNLTLTYVQLFNQIDQSRISNGRPPAICVWENVPGVLSTKDNAFGCFLAALAGECIPLQPPGGKWSNVGYVRGPQRAIAWRVLDAQYFGVAQRRRRVFLVASARDGFCPEQILLERDGMQRHFAPRREAGETLASHSANRTGDSLRGICQGSESDSTGASGQTESNAASDAAVGFETGPCGGSIIDTAPTLDTRCKDGPIRNQLGAGVLCMSTGQAGAEIGIGIGTTLNCNHEAPIVCTQYGDIAGSLTVRHDSSPCADRGQSVIAYRTSGNCGAYETGETVDALTTGTDQTSHILAFTCKDHGADAGEISPTLRSMSADQSHANGGGQVAIAIHDMATRHQGTNGSGADVGKGHGLGIAGPEDPMFTLTKGDKHAVMFERRFVRTSGGQPQDELSHCLRADNNSGDGAPCVAFAQNQRDEVRTMKVAGALAAEPGMKQQTFIATNHIVRRLTPTECEFLQGFPRNHTLIPVNGKPAADGPRYKSLGNSMAVPCMEWLGKRIQMMENL